MSSPPVVRDADRDLTTSRHQALGRVLGRTPERFRFGASWLLSDVLMQIRKERTGRCSGGDSFTID